MIKLALAMFLVSQKLLFLGADPPGSFCLELQIIKSHTSTPEVYRAAEKLWRDDTAKLEAFYAFWENVDTCEVK